jgi:hypothetical protein
MAESPDPVTLEAVGIGYREMLAISRKSNAWTLSPGTPTEWHNRKTGDIVTASTPEGVPDNYVYVSPDEEVGDEYDVVTSPQGATYRSPQPVSDTGDGDADGTRMTPEEATNSTELGMALGFDMPAHEVLEEGDTVTVDTEGLPEGYGLPDEAEGYIRFIDSDWVEIASGEQIATFPIEQIRSADVADYRGQTGVDKLVEAVPGATATDLAGGVAAAIDDDRDDFHDIRNAVVNAEQPMDAAELLADELTDDQLNDLLEEVETQERMRADFDVVDNVGELGIGQPILYDADRPKRGTVDDIDADGTVWLYDPNRDMRSGVNPEFGTLYADPEYEGAAGGTFTAESGRYGLASNSEVLENAFAAANDVTGSREAGIQGGNTTGDKMKILDMPDGSRVFATPVDAYPGPTGVVDSPEEARTNNLNSPRVIEALGGRAAQTATLSDDNGRDYIAKEGIPGPTLSEYGSGMGAEIPEERENSRRDTFAAAYFVGNRDLHGGNMVVSEDGELTIIDHDSAGFSSTMYGERQVADISRYNRYGSNADERIYELAQEIRSGERDLGVADYSEHADYANAAAEKAVKQAYLDPSYDLPEDQVPAELQFPPDGVYELDDLRDPNDIPDEAYGVEFVDDDADTKEGELLDIAEDGTIVVETAGRVKTFTDLNRLTEVYD